MKRKAHKAQQTQIAICAIAVTTTDGRIQIFPAGIFDAPNGAMAGSGPWKIDADSAARLIKRVAARSNDIVIDYEHQTLSAVENGKEAPAAGWSKPTSLEYIEGKGLYAAVNWTKKAQDYIDGNEYRYLSPVFSYNPKTGEVLDLHHIALTNNPAVDGMDAVGALAATRFGLEPPSEENPMNEALLALLGLKTGATENEVIAACKALQVKIAEQQTELTSKDEVIAAAKAGAPDPAKFVPIETVTQMQTELAVLKTDSATRAINELVDPAVVDGRLIGDKTIAWAKALGKTDIAALKTYLDNAQPVAALKSSQTKGNPPHGLNSRGELTDEALAVCKQMSIDPKAYKATLEEEVAP